MKKLLFICHGNICRSTMAEFVMKHLVKQAGREDEFEIASAATSCEEIGNPIHYGTKRKLDEVGITNYGKKRARRMTKEDYQKYDYLIGMEYRNIRNINRIIGSDPEHKVCRLLDFSDNPRDIADPWYTGNFDRTYDDIVEGCEGLLDFLLKNGLK